MLKKALQNLTPLCKSNRGCKIEELAKDTELTKQADTFFRLRALLANELYRPLAIEELKAHGLADPNLLLELEGRVSKYIKSQNKNSKSKVDEPPQKEMI